MKICVTSQSGNIDSKVDPRFGRCAYFLIVETDTLEFEAINNPNRETGGGAGIQSGELMSTKGVKAVLTGNVGPNAFDTLNAAGIKVYTGISGDIRRAVENFKAGGLKDQKCPTVESHAGIKGNRS